MAWQELGLRDYATIDLWVTPDKPPPTSMTEEDMNALLQMEEVDHLVSWDFLAPSDAPNPAGGCSSEGIDPADLCR